VFLQPATLNASAAPLRPWSARGHEKAIGPVAMPHGFRMTEQDQKVANFSNEYLDEIVIRSEMDSQ
jgi:hypothetical protein